MTADTHPTPLKERWFEDFTVGHTVEFGDYRVTEAEIIDFARRWDPQPFHVDPLAARDSLYGGLIASGWMTASIAMRMMVDQYIPPHASMGSPGIDQLRWLAPVRPGDRLRLRITVLEARRSQSKPDRGLVNLRWEMLDQGGTTVMTLVGWGMYRCRPID